ncbi:MAG: bifunctional lysine ketoglutarate reductase /saccharopine dehydrogenase family protein [Acidobacteriota bacterium]
MAAGSTIGIRLEDKSHWERRVPLVPADVVRLRDEHAIEAIVQPSAVRVFSDAEFREAGARLDSDLSPAGVVLAVKEVPIAKLLPDRCYAFFAHVIKGQRHNMPLLEALLEKNITLVDYEKIADAAGHRMVKFGRQAGQAGMIDSFWSLGERLAREGLTTPFGRVLPAHRYADVAEAEGELAEIGRQLLAGSGLDEPLIVGFTGAGSVTQGALDIFDLLPHTTVTPEELPEVAATRGDRDRLFKVIFEKHHLAATRDPDEAFDEETYRHHPERFVGRLHEFLPFLTVLINGIYWSPEYPRFVTKAHIQDLWRRGERRLRVIGDITCDIDGAFELTYKATDSDGPTYTYDPQRDRFEDGFDGEGVCVMAVDNLPCELPRDASVHFSRQLRELVPWLAEADFTRPFEELRLPDAVRRAVITHRGRLTPDFAYLQEALDAAREA